MSAAYLRMGKQVRRTAQIKEGFVANSSPVLFLTAREMFCGAPDRYRVPSSD